MVAGLRKFIKNFRSSEPSEFDIFAYLAICKLWPFRSFHQSSAKKFVNVHCSERDQEYGVFLRMNTDD